VFLNNFKRYLGDEIEDKKLNKKLNYSPEELERFTEEYIKGFKLETIPASKYVEQTDECNCGVILILAIEKICSYSIETNSAGKSNLFKGFKTIIYHINYHNIHISYPKSNTIYHISYINSYTSTIYHIL